MAALMGKGDLIMKIKEFIDAYKANNVQNTRLNEHAVVDYLIKELEVKTYVPFAEKRELCANVLNACNTRKNNGLIEVDSVSRYILFTVAIISKYTVLEFSSGEDDELDSLDEYDMLCQANLLDPILEVIGAEYVTCNNILNMMMSDIVSNNNTVENVIGHSLEKLNITVDGFVNVLSDKIESLNLDLNQIDIDKFKGLMEMLPRK